MSDVTTTAEQETSDRRIPATARLDPETFEFYQQWATREERTMSNVLHIALKRYKALATEQACAGS